MLCCVRVVCCIIKTPCVVVAPRKYTFCHPADSATRAVRCGRCCKPLRSWYTALSWNISNLWEFILRLHVAYIFWDRIAYYIGCFGRVSPLGAFCKTTIPARRWGPRTTPGWCSAVVPAFYGTNYVVTGDPHRTTLGPGTIDYRTKAGP